MASRTQMRLAQLTGSFGNAAGQITDQRPAQPVAGASNAAALTMTSGSLQGPLSEMASAIKRIHGGAQFAAAAPGQFFTDIKPSANDAKKLGASGLAFSEAHTVKLFLAGAEINALDADLASVSTSDDSVASAKAIKTYVDAQITAQDLDITSDSGSIDIDLDGDTLTVAGGEGINTSATSTTITVAMELATASNVGGASFSSADFAVSAAGAVTVKTAGIATAQIANDQITADLMADNSVDSDMYVDGSIDTAHYAAGSVDATAMGANSVDSDQYVDGSIDTIHIADAQITVAKMAANSVDSDQYADASIDTIHIAADQITQALIADNAVQKEHLNPNVAGSGLEQHSDDSLRLAAAAAGNGLTGGAGSALSVELETPNALAVTVDGLDLKNTIGGNRTFANDIIVGGNLTVNGAQFKIDGETVVMNDTLMEMGTSGSNNLPPGATTTKDLGLLLHRHDGTAARLQFMGWDESADKFIMRSSVTENNGVISDLGSAAALEVGALTAAASSVSTLGTSGLATLASAVVTGEADLRGDVKLGGDVNDLITPNGVFAGDLVPNDGTRKIGTAGGDKWAELHIAGEAIIDDIKLDAKTIAVVDAGSANASLTLAPKGTGSIIISKVDINGGAIDGADVTVGSGKELDVSAGTLTLANDQISGDKVEGGTIAGITITTVDINGGAIDGTAIGTSVRQSGKFAALEADGNMVFGDAAADNIAMNGTITGTDALRFEGPNPADGNDLTIRVASFDAARQIILPNADGTFAVSAHSNSGMQLSAEGMISLNINAANELGSIVLADNDRLLVADTSASGTEGKILMSQIKAYMNTNGVSKNAKTLSAAVQLSAGFAIVDSDLGSTFGAGAASTREVYVNGQLMWENASGDFVVLDQNAKFKFALEAEDVIQFIKRA